MSKKIFKTLDVLTPFTKDINNTVHGRALVKRLDLSQRTIQTRLNKFEDEGVLKSEMIGRTKEFRLNKENILTKLLLISVEINKFYNLISSSFELREIIKDILNITGNYVIIYGSFARGYWDEKSDLDILIIGKSNENLKKLNEKYSRETHFMFMKEEEFKGGIKEDEPYVKGIIENHIICRGFEEITDWRFENE